MGPAAPDGHPAGPVDRTDRADAGILPAARAAATGTHTPAAGAASLTVYYDGGCPVCSREIAMYRGQPGADAVQWVDAAHCEAPQLGSDLDRPAALARFHVRRSDGSLVSGAAAFTTLWQHLPRTARLGRWLGSRPALWVLEPGYRAFLRLRRLWRRA